MFVAPAFGAKHNENVMVEGRVNFCWRPLSKRYIARHCQKIQPYAQYTALTAAKALAMWPFVREASMAFALAN